MFSVFVMYEDEYKSLNHMEQRYLDRLMEKLSEQGIEIRKDSVCTKVDASWNNVDNYTKNRKDLLIATCKQERYDFWKQKDAAVFGFICPGYGDAYFKDSPVVVEGFEEIDVKFLERIYQRCHHLPWEIARTDRLVIRETILSDLPVFETMYQEKEAKRFLEPLYAKGAEDRPAYMQTLQRQYAFYGYGMWTVELVDGQVSEQPGKVIGRAGIENGTEAICRLGYLIGREYRGRGYASEACQAILDAAKEEFEIREIECFVHKDNKASLKLAKKLGFSCKIEYLNQKKSTDIIPLTLQFD